MKNSTRNRLRKRVGKDTLENEQFIKFMSQYQDRIRSIPNYNIFEDKDLMNQASKMFPKETQDLLIREGEKMFSIIDFKESKVIQNESGESLIQASIPIDFGGKVSDEDQKKIDEIRAYIVSSLKSGLHPSQLSPLEQEFMKNHYSEVWYEEFGFAKDDLN
jgi:hypothetical protein